MAESSESDHFSDIFDSTSDLTLVIGQLDRKLNISEPIGDDHGQKSLKSLTQPQSSDSATGQQLNKDNRSLSSSNSSLNDEEEQQPTGRGSCVLERAAMEIIDSEGSYVMDLLQVIEGYLHDWKERACLKLDELETLFGNIEQLYAVNSQLLERLKETHGDVPRIAQCFLDLRDEFIVYTTYCTRYPDAIALLTRLLQSTHTNALLTSTQKVLNHTLPLGSYLLKPVQRILKYHLLLDNLRKHCNNPEVYEAHQQMLKVARDIDQMKKALEQKGRVRQLCGILDGWLGPDLTVLGDLRHEGVLFNNNKPREVFLFDTMLIIAKAKEDRRLQFKSYIHRKDIMLVEQIPGEPCSFFVIPYSDPRNQIKFVARNRNQKRLWAHHIKSVMLEDLNIPNRAKDLVFQLGDEEDVTSEKAIKKWGHTSSTPAYLERRHRYRRSEIKERSAARNRLAKEALESSSSLNITETGKDVFDPCCADGKDCNCAVVKKELKEGMTKKLNTNAALEAASAMKNETPINKYTTNAMPKRIINLKKTRSKTVPSSIFYRTLGEITSSGQDLSDSPSGAAGTSIADSQEQLLPRSVSRDDESVGTGEEVLTGARMSSGPEASSTVRKNSERTVHGKSSTLRASDSHLNYAKGASKIEGGSPAILTRSNTISNTEQIGSSVSSSKVKKHHSSFYKSWRSVKEEESVLSYQHLPGSSDLGERIANNVDYVDPQRLFCVQASNRRSEALRLLKATTSGPRERDSVVSFTSSSDSVDENRSRQQQKQQQNSDSFCDDSYYEDNIERCLEDASMFRDSAIYSDDNDPRRVTSTSSGLETPPPPVPYKPQHVTELQQRRLKELALKRKLNNATTKEEEKPAPNKRVSEKEQEQLQRRM